MQQVRMKEIAGDFIRFEEIPDPQVDMKYKQVNANLLKYFTNVVRASYEYRVYIQHLKNFLDVDRCAFYEGYSIKNGFSVELHHSPYTMYDICEAVANKQFKSNDGYVKTFEVCEEVARLHYKFKVGLVPLNPTAHELVHAGELEIHPDIVLGHWEEFYTEYKEFLSEESLAKYERCLELRLEGKSDKVPKILERRQIRIQVPKFQSLGSMDLTKMLMETPQQRIEQIGKGE